MSPLTFIPFWELRRHNVAEEAVRGGSRRRRLEGPWTLPESVKDKLRPLLAPAGFDPSAPIEVREALDQDGFHFTQ